ncbi:MAG: zinc ribbon domain-containing protein [Nitrososphaerota archaeon]|nr:zinc ribbon domain-containing protein [Candidatus Bathyarchaeota archaeon]MDW8048892.1 zinc ribbon domain-containing protein [Nitrososphaerota archaeon]
MSGEDARLFREMVQSIGEDRLMVYCAKCGAQNPDDARYCIQCGTPLHISRERKEKEEKHEKHEKSEIWSPRLFLLLIGFIIFFWGLNQLLEVLLSVSVPLMPVILMIIGLYIIYRALTRTRPR